MCSDSLTVGGASVRLSEDGGFPTHYLVALEDSTTERTWIWMETWPSPWVGVAAHLPHLQLGGGLSSLLPSCLFQSNVKSAHLLTLFSLHSEILKLGLAFRCSCESEPALPTSVRLNVHLFGYQVVALPPNELGQCSRKCVWWNREDSCPPTFLSPDGEPGSQSAEWDA